MPNKSGNGRSGKDAIKNYQDADQNGIVGELVNNSKQERGQTVQENTVPGASQFEESRSHMKPSIKVPHGSKAVDTDKKNK